VVGLLVLATSVLVPAAPSAAQPPAVAPLPTGVVRPPSGKGVPWGAAAVEGATGSVDLAEVGYVEEELVVSGRANVYRYGPTGTVEVETAGVPYATRILVRRPQDPRRFSGNVYVETTHPEHGIDVVWAQTSDYLISNGDAYVSIATRRTTTAGFSAIEVMKSFDPVRYESLQFTEDGLTWDIVGQVGRLLKTSSRANPLRRYDVERLYATGWSGGGALLLLYISDGFHARARRPGGGPIYDGYLVGEPSGYPRINSTAAAIATSDPRQQVQPRDVPAISLHTRPQEQFRRRADGDRRGDRYRVYEVAGAAHADYRVSRGVFPTSVQFEDTFLGGGGPLLCAHEITRFPMHHLFKSTLERLDAWTARGRTPPPSQRITLGPDGTATRDEHGNPLSGVRTTYTDVPTARYFANEPAPGGSCAGLGAQERFSSDELDSLYGNHGRYVSRVVQRALELNRDGWLLSADARDVVLEAAHLDGF